jgi:hypothetical protein
MSKNIQLAKMSDDLFDGYEKDLSDAARVAGIRINSGSVKVCIGNGIRLASVVSGDLENAIRVGQDKQVVLGLIHASGRLGGDIPKPGIYIVRLEIDDHQRFAVLLDTECNEVISKVPMKITWEEVNPKKTNGCDSGSEVGPGWACTYFECCSPIGGCLGHSACFTL